MAEPRRRDPARLGLFERLLLSVMGPPQVGDVTPDAASGLKVTGENLENTAAVELTLKVKMRDGSQSSGQFTSQPVQKPLPTEVDAVFSNDFLPSPAGVASVEFDVRTVNADGRRSTGKTKRVEGQSDVELLFAAMKQPATAARSATSPPAPPHDTSDGGGGGGPGDKPAHGKGSHKK